MEKDFLHLIETRRSCRSYRPEQIADEQLEAILQAGTYAPSAMGAQSPYIVAVQNPGQIAQLSAMNARVMNTSADPYYGAPTLVLVFAPREAKNAVQDASCVLENMMLAAHALGVGSCWINREREMFATEEGVALMKQWGLPEGLCGVGALSLGYPAAEPSPRKPRKEDYVRVIR
ncbi:MAG TPA: nitroreductase [Bacteroidetes bacterium]|nr:nitroreductase [Bacteroidota bacterium]